MQKRPSTGPDARRFPRRGLGIAKIRRHLDQLGIDPDKLQHRGAGREQPAASTSDDVLDQLEQLRDHRDHGTI